MSKTKKHLTSLITLLEKEGCFQSEKSKDIMTDMLSELPEEMVEYLHDLYLEQGMKALHKTITK